MPKTVEPSGPPGQSLAEFLQNTREAKGMTLREVEEKSHGEISNAYLSQLEHGRVKKPSPNALHTLARVYEVSYPRLMQKAGYVVESPSGRRLATFANKKLTPEEEDELLRYLAYLRSRKASS